MSLTDKLNDANILLFGNRVTLASELLVLGGAADAICDISGAGIATDLSALTVGLVGMGVTKAGFATLEYYHLAKDHFRKNSRSTYSSSDKRFEAYFGRIIKVISNNSNSPSCFGYCEEQGLYLAAKEFGFEDAFNRAHSKYSSIKIPHF